ncbi:Vesicle transport protein [Entamoeba marina]
MTEESENLTQHTEDTSQPNRQRKTIDGSIMEIQRVIDSIFTEFGNTFLNFNPFVLCIIATCGSFIGGFVIFLFKRDSLIARAYAIQSIIVNGLLCYASFILLIASFFSRTILWIFFLMLFVAIITWIAQISMVIIGKAEKFIGFPYISSLVYNAANEGPILPSN